MNEIEQKLSFSSDYMEGAHPEIIKQLEKTNLLKTPGYGLDTFSSSAKSKIQKACNCPDAEIYFLVGGTQTNATVIDAILSSYQGVLAPESGHISVHEAGAIEFGGHKILTLPQKYGKITASSIEDYMITFQNDDNREHMVMPGMVYISQPTEYGTLYSLQELTNISQICHHYSLRLYVDGARLAYALACPENTVTLPDLAALCDVFYIGGTKCGALFGEAVIVPHKDSIPHFFTIIKQHGALFAKGRILGLQFDTLFTDDLYLKIGESAILNANLIKTALIKNGFQLFFESPTNQIFVVMDNQTKEKLEAEVIMGFWEKYDDEHTVMRFATSWATNTIDVNNLLTILDSHS